MGKTIQIKVYILLAKDPLIEINGKAFYKTWVKEVFFNEQDALDSMTVYASKNLFLGTEYEMDMEILDIPLDKIIPEKKNEEE